MNLIDHAKAFLMGRTAAYRRVFAIESADAQVVLNDLAKFCRARTSTAHVDPYMAARLDGRREAWIRIHEHLRLSDDELWAVYGNKSLTSKGDDK